MDKQKPNISIIIPIYNVELYLQRCVDSLLKQTYRDFELILVDDGSPDRCGVICDEYAAADPRISVIHKQNGGLSDARNAGLAIARGEYIAFVDSDDWVAPDYLERLFTALTETSADICACAVLKTDGTAAVPAEKAGVPEAFETAQALKLLVCDSVFHQYVWNKLYRRSVISDILFPKGKTNEDEFWTYRVFGNARKVARIPDVLYFYFQRPGSIMGESYSLKRLDALEGKLGRQKYLDDRFPELSLTAKRNLFGSCIYAGQMSLIHLSGLRKKEAKKKIMEIVRDTALTFPECKTVDGSNKLWFALAKVSFWGTCRVKNLLKKGF